MLHNFQTIDLLVKVTIIENVRYHEGDSAPEQSTSSTWSGQWIGRWFNQDVAPNEGGHEATSQPTGTGVMEQEQAGPSNAGLAHSPAGSFTTDSQSLHKRRFLERRAFEADRSKSKSNSTFPISYTPSSITGGIGTGTGTDVTPFAPDVPSKTASDVPPGIQSVLTQGY